MRWKALFVLICTPLLGASTCSQAPSSGNAAPLLFSMPWVSTVKPCQRTPSAPEGLIDQAALEAYIAELSKRLEVCADKVETQNNRIERARRRKAE